MNPRLKSSTKWTNLPQDVTVQIQQVFEQNFQKELHQARIIVEGRLYPHEILLRVGYIETGRLTQNNFEISMDYVSGAEDAALNTIHTCVDVAASLMTEYFEADGELEIPNIWTEFPFEDEKVWLQFTTENSSLEKEANELLGDWDDSLVQEAEDLDDDFDDAESGDDPDDDDSGPKGNGTLH